MTVGTTGAGDILAMARRAGYAVLLGLALLVPGAAPLLAQGVPVPVIEAPTAVSPMLPGSESDPSRTPRPRSGAPGGQQVRTDQPITFTAGEVEYDRDNATVTARGRVEAWQGERILRADEFTYNRNTGVATARGNVQILEPDGQVLFAESAVLSNRMRDGVIEALRGYLAQNARVAANGATRTNENLFDLARVLYTACEPCAENPMAPPIWQLRARSATLDREAGQVRYRDASIMFGGIPLFYTPYFQHPDGHTPRQSGFLSPSLGATRFLGGFTEIPYYWAINANSDLLLTPIISTSQYPNLGIDYRNRFNFGELAVSGSLGYRNGSDGDTTGFGYHIFARGRFTIDENWRAGFDINRAASEQYLRSWRYGARRVLPSNFFTEGFWGTDGYARIDARAYQGLRSTDEVSQIPLVLPNIYADWVHRDPWGGTFTVDTSNFAVFRSQGTDTRRLASRVGYVLPGTDSLGGVWALRMQSDIAAYNYDQLNEQPNNVTSTPYSGNSAQANIRAAIDWRMPFIRPAGAYGHQIIEPRVQFVAGPMTGQQTRVPNEDSIDFEFSDANLFSLNRYTGRDRQEGGTRVDYALRGAWYFPNGGVLESLVGQSYRVQNDGGPFYFNSGVENRASDIVGRVRMMPVPWLEFLGRARFAPDTFERRAIDFSSSAMLGRTTLTGGYFYTVAAPYITPVTDREEVYGGVTQRIGQFWRVSAFGRYGLNTGRPVVAAATVAYDDDCFTLEARFIRRFAEDPTTNAQYSSNTMLLLRLTLRTVADFGFRAL